MEPERTPDSTGDETLPSPVWLRLAKYLWGGLYRDERTDFEQWMANDPRRSAEIAELEQAWTADANAAPAVSATAAARAQRAFERVAQRAGFSPEAITHASASVAGRSTARPTDVAPESPSSRRMRPPARTIAAPASRRAWMRPVAGLTATAAAVVAVVTIASAVHRSASNAPEQRYSTTAGQRATITLPDSTRVTLAPQTTLVVAGGFGQSHRDVSLVGQAYFNVTHAPGQPFTVQTGNVRTRVLGTAFDVLHYADDRDVRVVVATGRVAVTTPRRAAVTLVPHMLGRITDSTTLVTTVGDVTPYSAWTRGTLEFHEVPVSDVLRAAGRWYGVRFELTDSALATHPITTFLEYSNTRDLVVALETLLNVTATSNGPVVTLRPRAQSSRPAAPRRDRPTTLSLTPEVGR